MFKFLPIAVLTLAVALAADAAAQTTTGTISGRVADTQGLPLPGVTVTAARRTCRASARPSRRRTATTSSQAPIGHLHADVRAERLPDRSARR